MKKPGISVLFSVLFAARLRGLVDKASDVGSDGPGSTPVLDRLRAVVYTDRL